MSNKFKEKQWTNIRHQEEGTSTATSKDNPLPVREMPFRTAIDGLTFSETLSPLGSYVTSWINIQTTNWLDVAAKVESTSAVTALIEFTDAEDPNTTSPGVDDILRSLTTTIGGTALGGASNVISFGIPAQLSWCRVTVTDITGGQDIDVTVFDHDIPPPAAQLPLAAPLTTDFRLPVVRNVPTGEQPDGDFVNQKSDGNAFSTTTPLGADGTYTSDWVDTDGWRSIEIVIKSDVVSQERGVCIQFTRDAQAGTPLADVTEEYEYGLQDISNGSLSIRIPTTLDGFRVVYKNSSTAQTEFFLSADLKTDLVEIPRVRDGGILTSAPWRLVFKDTFELSGALVSGATPTFDKTGPIVAANVIDTGWFNVRRYKEQLINVVFDIADVRVFLMNASDDQGNNTPTSSFAPGTENIKSPGFGFPAVQGAPFFGDYFRIVIVNDTGNTANAFSIRSMGGDTPVGEVFQSLDQPIFDFYPAPITQSVIKGKSPSGNYQAVATDASGRLTITTGSDFSRLLARNVEDDDRIRVDAEPGTGYIYLGTAPRGTAGSATEWKIAKILMSATFNPSDLQFKSGIAWDDRNNAAHWDTTA